MRIYTFPHPILREKCKKVTDFGDEFQLLVGMMLEEMSDAGGVGLAAPQIGKPLRLFVARHRGVHVVANPVITGLSFDREIDTEACLSLPGLQKTVERFKSISIKYQNIYGDTTEFNADGYLARIFQHEMNHLDGIMIDRSLY